jgi:hypothetical protein
MPLGYRSSRVLAVIAAQPGASNREVADAAEVSDQGQISKLLVRLQHLGLIHNPGEWRAPWEAPCVAAHGTGQAGRADDPREVQARHVGVGEGPSVSSRGKR